MKIIIFGATGTGKTTLGESISKKLNWIFLDSDDYYWKKTDPPFEEKILLKSRNNNLKTDFEKNENVIVSGSLCTWSNYWNTAFDLGIFLRIPKKVRMERLSSREVERYGIGLYTNDEIIQKSKAFLDWAEKYDDQTFDGHSISQHKKWITVLDCEVTEINGNFTNDERQLIVLKKVEDYQNNVVPLYTGRA